MAEEPTTDDACEKSDKALSRQRGGSNQESRSKIGGGSGGGGSESGRMRLGSGEWGKKIRVSCFVKKEIDVEHWMMIRWLKIYEIFRMLIQVLTHHHK